MAQLFSDLEQDIKGKIVTASDEFAYENEVNKSWNAVNRNRRPLAFVKVKGKEDVKKIVRFCAKHELEVCVYNGGTSAFCMKDEAVVIDLSTMCNVQVDAENKTAIIEGGAKVADVNEALGRHDFVIPLGSFSQLGVAGMTLNTGGQGFLSKRFGMTCDNVLEFDLVLASGELIKVSADEHPELFWGMKGHGSSFGIVTSMKFQLNVMSSQVVAGSMYFPFSRAKDVVKMSRDYSVEADDNCLSFYMLIHIGPTGPEMIVRVHYSGTLRRGGEIVQDLVDLTHPYKFSCGPVNHCDFQKQGDLLLPSGRFNYNVPGHILSELKDVIIDNIFSCVEDIGTDHFLAGTIVYMAENFGGKDCEVGYEESSFPFRNNARYWIGINASTKKEENFEAVKDWGNHFQDINSEYGIPPFDGGDAEQIMDKLKRLKQQYDPNNMFHNNFVPIDGSE
ncbi:FAD-linked oxidoreductase DDB_G0289697 isoform X2 [Exaiptasia diaphana]|uniref:FAD-binding PCMH-type domain-containing protein n=1 Tax=Exaiptasia diaphana TaxID=2652724 RepID=A0A913YF99_EXADI|nr:FAD-linked oxidoreductase DDB_G0289697 isoform X2 [Exaiptasia diaphana]